MDEDDYMSEKILEQCSSNDVRPGLLFTKKLQREHELSKRKAKFRPFKEVSEERRKEGLKTELPQTNKGFQLLEKMGYKPGTNVGKSGKGMLVPLDVDVKNDFSGLGHKTKIMERQPSNQINSNSTNEFRTLVKRRQELNQLKSDLRKIRRTCFTLDTKNNLKTPVTDWFWPENELPSNEDSEDANVEDEAQKSDISVIDEFDELQSRTNDIGRYLREQYNYCPWCSCHYDDEKDMAEMCPGITREEHI